MRSKQEKPVEQEARKPGEKALIMALWLLNHSPAFIRVSWFPGFLLHALLEAVV
jgi:hypothetical protein